MPTTSPSPRRRRAPAKPEAEAAPPLLTPEARAAYERTSAAWPKAMLWPLGKIGRYTNNPRINDPAVPDVMASLTAFGARQPIVVRRQDQTIIVGDTRWLAAERLGWPAFPVHEMECTEAEARAYRIADNKTGERAEWDFPRLREEFETLRAQGMDLQLTGWRDYELSPILMSSWAPPAAQTLGAPSQDDDGAGGSADERGDRPLVKFDGEQWPRVLRAAERLRERAEQPTLDLAEALTRICLNYLRAVAAGGEAVAVGAGGANFPPGEA